MKQIQELVMYTNTFTVDVCPNIFDYMLYKLYISTLNRCSLMKLQNLNVDGPTSTKLLSKRDNGKLAGQQVSRRKKFTLNRFGTQMQPI